MGFLDGLKEIGSSALDLGANLIGSKYQSDLQGHQADREFDRNRGMQLEMFNLNKDYTSEMWEKDKAYQMDLWNRQNEYNSPLSQMKRLSEAGLNPNLMYGQGTTGISTSIKSAEPDMHFAEAPEMKAPRYEGTKWGDDMLGGALKYLQIKNADAENKNLAATRSLIAQNARKAGLDADLQEYELDLTKKSGMSTRDYPWLRIFGRAGTWADQHLNKPLWDATKGFLKRVSDSDWNKTYK